jgi:inositol-phosphate phosphatase / L-galactose 1-phosphate phosphatase / histidinol-phosphatase
MVTAADIALAHRLAEAARAEIVPRFRLVGAERKPDASPVTEADRAAEEAMRRLLKAEVPQDGVVGEEFGTEEGRSGRQWVLDPIDGTTAFLAGRPLFGTLIALLEDGFPVLGIIDQAILGERWLGVAGQGTTFNGRPAHTRLCPAMENATIATTGPHYFTVEQGSRFMALAGATDHKRMVMGGDCYNYAMLASGHVDMVVEAGLKLHDYAALVPVVEGAGGLMSDWNGDPARLEDVIEALG